MLAFVLNLAEAGKSEEQKQAELNAIIEQKSNTAIQQHNRQKPGAVIVDGVGNLLTHIAKCCQPIPGDEIVGFITKGRGVSIHRRSCEQLKALALSEPEKVVPAQWGSSGDKTYTITMRITGQDYSGMLRDITTLIANEKLNIAGVRSRVDSKNMTSIIDIDLLVTGLSAFDRLAAKIRAIPQITSIERM